MAHTHRADRAVDTWYPREKSLLRTRVISSDDSRFQSFRYRALNAEILQSQSETARGCLYYRSGL